MIKERDTIKYSLYPNMEGHRVLRGCTSDLKRREEEHRVRYPAGTVEQVGHKSSRHNALKWVKQGTHNLAPV